MAIKNGSSGTGGVSSSTSTKTESSSAVKTGSSAVGGASNTSSAKTTNTASTGNTKNPASSSPTASSPKTTTTTSSAPKTSTTSLASSAGTGNKNTSSNVSPSVSGSTSAGSGYVGGTASAVSGDSGSNNSTYSPSTAAYVGGSSGGGGGGTTPVRAATSAVGGASGTNTTYIDAGLGSAAKGSWGTTPAVSGSTSGGRGLDAAATSSTRAMTNAAASAAGISAMVKQQQGWLPYQSAAASRGGGKEFEGILEPNDRVRAARDRDGVNPDNALENLWWAFNPANWNAASEVNYPSKVAERPDVPVGSMPWANTRNGVRDLGFSYDGTGVNPNKTLSRLPVDGATPYDPLSSMRAPTGAPNYPGTAATGDTHHWSLQQGGLEQSRRIAALQARDDIGPGIAGGFAQFDDFVQADRQPTVAATTRNMGTAGMGYDNAQMMLDAMTGRRDGIATSPIGPGTSRDMYNDYLMEQMGVEGGMRRGRPDQIYDDLAATLPARQPVMPSYPSTAATGNTQNWTAQENGRDRGVIEAAERAQLAGQVDATESNGRRAPASRPMFGPEMAPAQSISPDLATLIDAMEGDRRAPASRPMFGPEMAMPPLPRPRPEAPYALFDEGNFQPAPSFDGRNSSIPYLRNSTTSPEGITPVVNALVNSPAPRRDPYTGWRTDGPDEPTRAAAYYNESARFPRVLIDDDSPGLEAIFENNRAGPVSPKTDRFRMPKASTISPGEPGGFDPTQALRDAAAARAATPNTPAMNPMDYSYGWGGETGPERLPEEIRPGRKPGTTFRTALDALGQTPIESNWPKDGLAYGGPSSVPTNYEGKISGFDPKGVASLMAALGKSKSGESVEPTTENLPGQVEGPGFEENERAESTRKEAEKAGKYKIQADGGVYTKEDIDKLKKDNDPVGKWFNSTPLGVIIDFLNGDEEDAGGGTPWFEGMFGKGGDPSKAPAPLVDPVVGGSQTPRDANGNGIPDDMEIILGPLLPGGQTPNPNPNPNPNTPTPNNPNNPSLLYDRFGDVVFPALPPYNPGVDPEHLYFRKRAFADGGLVDAYAEGGAVTGLDMQDPRVETIAKAEDALEDIVAGRQPSAEERKALEDFTAQFGQEALKSLYQNVQSGMTTKGKPRMVEGPGGPQDDAIPARVENVEEAALSNGEFVMPAEAVAEMGEGDPMVGAQRLQELSERLTGARRQPEVNVERVS